MWELDYKESWEQKNWCFWTVVLEKTLESPLDCKESQSIHHKVNKSWIFIGKTDAEAETPILCPPDAKNWLIGKDLVCCSSRGCKELDMTERLNWTVSSLEKRWLTFSNWPIANWPLPIITELSILLLSCEFSLYIVGKGLCQTLLLFYWLFLTSFGGIYIYIYIFFFFSSFYTVQNFI